MKFPGIVQASNRAWDRYIDLKTGFYKSAFNIEGLVHLFHPPSPAAPVATVMPTSSGTSTACAASERAPGSTTHAKLTERHPIELTYTVTHRAWRYETLEHP
jgi:hypothetical protein